MNIIFKNSVIYCKLLLLFTLCAYRINFSCILLFHCNSQTVTLLFVIKQYRLLSKEKVSLETVFIDLLLIIPERAYNCVYADCTI